MRKYYIFERLKDGGGFGNNPDIVKAESPKKAVEKYKKNKNPVDYSNTEVETKPEAAEYVAVAIRNFNGFDHILK